MNPLIVSLKKIGWQVSLITFFLTLNLIVPLLFNIRRYYSYNLLEIKFTILDFCYPSLAYYFVELSFSFDLRVVGLIIPPRKVHKAQGTSFI